MQKEYNPRFHFASIGDARTYLSDKGISARSMSNDKVVTASNQEVIETANMLFFKEHTTVHFGKFSGKCVHDIIEIKGGREWLKWATSSRKRSSLFNSITYDEIMKII